MGWIIGILSLPFLTNRSKIIKRNLELCFRNNSKWWIFKTRIIHHALLGRFMVDHTILLAASKKRIKRLITIKGEEQLRKIQDRPVILLAPHFIGLDIGAVRMAIDYKLTALFTPQHSDLAETLVHRARKRLTKDNLYLINNLVNNSIKQTIESLNNKRILYYLNDIDQRDRSKICFVPFLDVKETATLTSLPRIARMTDAVVLSCVTIAKPFGGYEIEISEPWENFPSDNVIEDMTRFNNFVAKYAKLYPSQYYWPHRRFKTRPTGEKNLYA